MSLDVKCKLVYMSKTILPKPSRYNWNIVESDIKHYNPNPPKTEFELILSASIYVGA
jgi:hypothetical protein